MSHQKMPLDRVVALMTAWSLPSLIFPALQFGFGGALSELVWLYHRAPSFHPLSHQVLHLFHTISYSPSLLQLGISP